MLTESDKAYELAKKGSKETRFPSVAMAETIKKKRKKKKRKKAY